ncbi:MAG TPA: FG-GAP repeat protein, partial [Acidimicrobiia bacterium]|nr:FG-GAP repeat protein [Acidimicrobiia bacterium]
RTGSTWAQQAKLMPTEPIIANDLFGTSVALSGDTAVVGVPYDDIAADGLNNEGSAYVFVRTGTTWAKQARLTALDAAGGDEFGWSVAVSGDTAVVGAPYDDAAGGADGAARVFVRSGTTWTQQALLTGSHPVNAFDEFGWSVAVSGDTAVVGAPRDEDKGVNTGSASVFVRSGTTWALQAKLTAADAAPNDNFGYSVAVSGDTAIVGAPYDDDAGADSGSAAVFVRSGTTWSRQVKVSAPEASAGDRFGWSVAVDGDTKVLGAPGDDDAGADSGSAYVFVRPPTGSPSP